MEHDSIDLELEMVGAMEPPVKRQRVEAHLDPTSAVVDMEDVSMLPLSAAVSTAWLSILIRLQYALRSTGERSLMLLVPSLEYVGGVKNKAILLEADGSMSTRDPIIRFPVLPGVIEAQILTKDVGRISSVIRATCIGLVKLVDGRMCKVAEPLNPMSAEFVNRGVLCEMADGTVQSVARADIASITWTAPISIIPITRPSDVSPVVPCNAHYSLASCRQSRDNKLTLTVHGANYELRERDPNSADSKYSLSYMCRSADGQGSVPALVALPENYIIPVSSVSVAMKISAQDVVANINSNMQVNVNEVRLDGRVSGRVSAAQVSMARLTGYDQMTGEELPNRAKMTRCLPALVTSRREVSKDQSYGSSNPLCCYGFAIKDEAAGNMLNKAIRPTWNISREASYAPYVVPVDTWLAHMGLNDLADKAPQERVARLASWVSMMESLKKEKNDIRARYTR